MAHSAKYKSIMQSREWRALRSEVLSEHPICQECKRKASRCVHHIRPIEGAHTDQEAERRAYDKQNCMALCFECHRDKHCSERYHSRTEHRARAMADLSRWADRMKGKQ